MIKSAIIKETLENRLGIRFSVETGALPDREFCKTRPTGLELGRGFYIQSDLKWRTLRSSLIFEEFSRPLTEHLGNTPFEIKTGFLDFIVATLSNAGNFNFSVRIDDQDFTKIDPTKQWHSFEFTVEQSPINIDVQHEEDYISDQQRILLEAILLLMDLELVEDFNDIETAGFPEGSLIKVEVNKYERNRLNREACLRVNGISCKVCGFDFEKTYGPLGKGFIHVHHITPVSKIGSEYIINPVKDLLPVCPNCHAMIHRKDPPLDPEYLKNLLFERKAY